MNETEFGITVLVPGPTRVRCHYCREPLSGLLSVCPKPDCVRQDIADTVAYERSCE